MSDCRYIGRNLAKFTPGKPFAAYSRVVINIDDDTAVSAGNSSGYTLTIDCPWGTQAMAENILRSLAGRAYQPYKGADAHVDPAVELGDALSVCGVFVGLYQQSSSLTAGSVSTISAPGEQEINHEYPYKSPTTRKFSRQTKALRAEITLLDGRITAEAEQRISGTESLSARIDLTAGRLTSEVSRATSAEGTLRTLIDQKVGSVTIAVSSRDGSTTLTLTDGTTQLDSKTFDLTVDVANIHGKLSVGKIQDGAVVVSSKTETQYYLSTSASAATGGSWSAAMPTWSSGKYLWTRQKTTDTKNNSSSPSVSYSPAEAGCYDENLTTALRTAAEASTDASNAQSSANSAATAASNAQSSANSAVSRSQLIYCSMPGGEAPAAPTQWVTRDTNVQNQWTTRRPQYSSSYPALYIATQKQTVGGTVSCTTPLLDYTTTIIDGAHIITGTIDASKISVQSLQAISANLAGWNLSNSTIRKQGDSYDVYLQAPVNPNSDHNAIAVRALNADKTELENKFIVTYGGYVFAKNAEIIGKITATSGTIGDCSIVNGVLQVPSANITGTLTAAQISVNNLQAISNSLAGWSLSASTIRNRGDKYDVYFQAPQSPLAGYNAIYVGWRDSENDAFDDKFYVTYGGYVYAKNANISGTINATSGTIGGITLANGKLTIDNDHLGSGAVGTANIIPGSVTGGSGGSLGTGTISSDNLGTGSVITAKLSDSAVTTVKLSDLCVTTGKLGAGAVTEGKLADGAVTTNKLADNAITGTKIAPRGITAVCLADNSVTTDKLSSGVNTSLGYANSFGNATKQASGIYPDFFRAKIIYVDNAFQIGGAFQFGQNYLRKATATIAGQTINYVEWY